MGTLVPSNSLVVGISEPLNNIPQRVRMNGFLNKECILIGRFDPNTVKPNIDDSKASFMKKPKSSIIQHHANPNKILMKVTSLPPI